MKRLFTNGRNFEPFGASCNETPEEYSLNPRLSETSNNGGGSDDGGNGNTKTMTRGISYLGPSKAERHRREIPRPAGTHALAEEFLVRCKRTKRGIKAVRMIPQRFVTQRKEIIIMKSNDQGG